MPLFQNESSCKTLIDLHENEPVGGTHYHMNGLARKTRSDRGETFLALWALGSLVMTRLNH